MLIFEVYGKPVPQKQTQFAKRGANIHAYDPSKASKDRIQWQINPNKPDTPIMGPVSMDITFYLPIPESTSAIKKRQMANQVILPITKPDVDNLAYLVTNALKKLVYQDDAQIVDLYLHKRYGENPRTVIKVTPIVNAEQNRAESTTEEIVKKSRKKTLSKVVPLCE